MPPNGGKNQLSGNSSSENSASVISFSFSMTCSDSSQGSFIGRQVTLHQAQLLHQTQSGAGIVEHHQRQFLAIKVHEHLSLSGTQQGCTPGHRISLLRQPVKPAFPAWKGGCSAPVLRLRRLCP